ncbi:tetratricopeptide repeat protein [Flavobacterium gelidilacus]|uniref:tetratricopeptide repeat protein n=1 Tax=Flavobacterium gelidilacus TaxID=206041 RepID=UPI0003F8E48A|nr:tetratricopeptide repeat protein [Flavobacterium gelidilacus]
MFISFPVIEKSQNLTKNFNISNVEIFNNIAYNYEQLGNYNEAIFLLEKIVKKDPNRVVAWLNLADAQWGNDENKEAKVSYQKYISLMKSQNKDIKKIPQRVYERNK